MEKYDEGIQLINQCLNQYAVKSSDTEVSAYTINQLLHNKFDVFYGAFYNRPELINGFILYNKLHTSFMKYMVPYALYSKYINSSSMELSWNIIPYYYPDHYAICFLLDNNYRYWVYKEINSENYYFNTQFIHNKFNKKINLSSNDQVKLADFYKKNDVIIRGLFNIMEDHEEYSGFLDYRNRSEPIELVCSYMGFDGSIQLHSTGNVISKISYSYIDDDFVNASWDKSRDPLRNYLDKYQDFILQRIPISTDDLPDVFRKVYDERKNFNIVEKQKEYFK